MRSWMIFKGVNTALVLMIAIYLFSCCTEEEPILKEVTLRTQFANLGSHSLSYAISDSQGEVVIFENGLGDNYRVWSDVVQFVGQEHQVILYDRGGYRSSQLGPIPRDVVQLAKELNSLIGIVAPEKKVFLVGHSLGGALIRAYAVTFPEKVAGLVFVDASHEEALVLTQRQEDDLVSFYTDTPGAARESEMLIEGMDYLRTLGRLPNVPAVALSSVKGKSAAEASVWVDLHKSMGSGLTYFRQISTAGSGHHIQLDEPDLVVDAINEVIN